MINVLTVAFFYRNHAMALIKGYTSECDDSQTPTSTSESEIGLFTLEEIMAQLGMGHLSGKCYNLQYVRKVQCE